MKGNIIITYVHSSLPSNRKAAEITQYMRQLVSVTFTPAEYDAFIVELTGMVAGLNEKYPSSKAYWVRKSLSKECVSVALEGTDRSIWAALHPIGISFTEFKNNK